MSDDEGEYEYDYGSDAEEEDYGSEGEEGTEGNGVKDELIEIENAFYGRLPRFCTAKCTNESFLMPYSQYVITMISVKNVPQLFKAYFISKDNLKYDK
jgi:hypothetical protein